MVTILEYSEKEWLKENKKMYSQKDKTENLKTPFTHWEQNLKSVNKTELYNKFEMVIYTDDRKISYDVAHDFLNYPYPFKDNTFDYVLTRHVLEHFGRRELYKVFRELHRITKEDGIIEIIVPYVSCSHSFHDPTHITYFS